MANLMKFIKKYKKYFLIGLVPLVVILYFIFKHGSAQTDFFTVRRTDVAQSVLLSGRVQTIDRADLGFADAGRVANIFVKNNENVLQGRILAQLEIGDLLADLKIKEANLRSATVDLEAAKDNLDKVTKQEDAKVESAYRELLSDGLVLVPDSDEYGVEPPTITGLYNGRTEGEYKVVISKDVATSREFQVRTFGLEKTLTDIKENGPTPLGSEGLYISFPEDISNYRDTTWFLDIPNKSSSVYLANFNAYNEARKNRDQAVEDAQFEYKKVLSESDSGISTVAQAEIQKINAEIKRNTIYAPFSGKVTNIEKEIGENVSVGERVISILGEDKLEVVLKISELDVSRIPPGTHMEMTLDALPGEKFDGTLKTINSRETTVDGVPVYEAFVELPSDNRIKTGMSANGVVVLETKKDVLAIPSYLIQKSGETNMVQVLNEKNNKEERVVTLGLLGTDSMVEILSGLSEGDRVVSEGTSK